jgi:SAM-dependent methyltransferase
MRRFGSRIIERISEFFGGVDSLVPPRRLIDDIGGGDFQKIGNEFFAHFTRIGGLQPHHRVLDVGCGCGRMAVPMIPFLAEKGEYYGFDIAPDAIKWTQKHVTARYPHFHFDLADIHNKLYNPRGKLKSGEYRFPYQDNFFDFTLLTSVFTHLLAADMENYLAEIARTLKVGGRCMISFFLLNDDSKALTAKGNSSIDFKYQLENCVTSNQKVPESAIAFEESFIRGCFGRLNLKIIEPIHYGKWPGREKFLSYQDVILAVKEL